MKLFFNCPVTRETFQSADYTLLEGYQVVEGDGGSRELTGKVRLNSACPACGQHHIFQVGEVMCPLCVGKE